MSANLTTLLANAVDAAARARWTPTETLGRPLAELQTAVEALTAEVEEGGWPSVHRDQDLVDFVNGTFEDLALGDVFSWYFQAVEAELGRSVPGTDVESTKLIQAHEAVLLVEAGLRLDLAADIASRPLTTTLLSQRVPFHAFYTPHLLERRISFLRALPEKLNRLSSQLQVGLVTSDLPALRKTLTDVYVLLGMELVIHANGYVVGRLGELSRLVGEGWAALQLSIGT